MIKTAVITGASRGIGRAIAVKLASEGYNIVLNSKNGGENLENTLQFCRNICGDRVIALKGDVSDPSFVKELVSTAITFFGRIDVLINNAGISYVGLIQDTADDIWQNVINTNLSSVHYCTREVIPHMLKNRPEKADPTEPVEAGHIINISSVWGNVGASCETAYSASKGGVNAYTKACAKELAPSGISVNAVACGFVDTDMNSHLTKEERLSVIDQIPASRAASPDEIADIIYHIAEMPVYLTGQIITADGGWI